MDANDRTRARLRELREQAGLTLDEIGRRAGMAGSNVSRLESGARRLSLDHLAPLARALGVTVDDLLVPAPRPDPRIRPQPREVDGIIHWPLTRAGPAQGLHAFKVRIPPGRIPEMRVHEGHDWIYVLSGRLRLILGDDDLIVEPGEAAEFSTMVPHWIGAIDEPVEAIAILGPHGERVHLHP